MTAGAIDSPRLLLPSRIGPKADLQKLNVSIVKDVPAVGQPLADHQTMFSPRLLKPLLISLQMLNK